MQHRKSLIFFLSCYTLKLHIFSLHIQFDNSKFPKEKFSYGTLPSQLFGQIQEQDEQAK